MSNNTKVKSAVDVLSDRITKAVVDGVFFGKVENNNTHIIKHVVDSNINTLDRVLSDNGAKDRYNKSISDKKQTTMNSGFNSEDEAYENIEECMLFKSKDISLWTLNASQNSTMNFDVELSEAQGYSPVGYGYIVSRDTNTISEYSTHFIRVVLQKDNRSELGFNLLTAYPDIIRKENRIPTERDISELAKQTDTYKNASPVAKGYIAYQTSNGEKPYLITFKEGERGNIRDDVMSLHIPYDLKDGTKCEHVVRIKENQMSLATRQMDANNRWQKIPNVYTRKFNGENQINLSVDLTRPEVIEEFAKRNPVVAKIAIDINAVVNPKVIDIKQKKAELEERLLPRNDSLSEGLRMEL